MSSAQPGSSTDFDQWPYEQLRRAAFERARQRLDLGFFAGLFEHTTALEKTMDEGGSLGDIGGSLAELFEAGQQVFGAEGVGEREPLFRAVFVNYLRQHGTPSH